MHLLSVQVDVVHPLILPITALPLLEFSAVKNVKSVHGVLVKKRPLFQHLQALPPLLRINSCSCSSKSNSNMKKLYALLMVVLHLELFVALLV